jgi:hypothetical protein
MRTDARGVTQLDAEGTACHRALPAPKTLGDFVLAVAETVGMESGSSCIAAGVPRRTPRPPRQLSEEPPNALFFCVAVFLAVTAAVGGILKEEIESTTTSLCRSLQPATHFQ